MLDFIFTSFTSTWVALTDRVTNILSFHRQKQLSACYKHPRPWFDVQQSFKTSSYNKSWVYNAFGYLNKWYQNIAKWSRPMTL